MIEKIHSTPLGSLRLIVKDEALIYCKWIQDSNEDEWTGCGLFPLKLQEERLINHICKEIDLYFEGKLQNFTFPIKFDGTPFQLSVWEIISKIPYGQTISYAQLAREIGKPKCVRALAQACGSNPIVVVVPCHRVINSNGKIGGYTGGIDKKIRLLAIEGVKIFDKILG